MKIKMTYIY